MWNDVPEGATGVHFYLVAFSRGLSWFSGVQFGPPCRAIEPVLLKRANRIP